MVTLCKRCGCSVFFLLCFQSECLKVHIFNGNSEGIINSQGAVFLSSTPNKVPEGRAVRERVGWVVRRQCGDWRAGVDCGFGDIREGRNCAGHVALREK